MTPIFKLVKALNKIGGFNLLVPPKTRLILALVVILAPGLLLLAVLAQPWVEPKWMFLDMLTAAEFSDDCCHVYYGFMSNLGIFLWVATAAISLFAAMIFYNWKSDKALFRFALTSGLFSGWLALDDGFLLHETVLPKLGIGQNLVLAIYVLLALSYILSSWRVILSSEYWILALAVFGVSLSLGVDVILHSIDQTVIIIEDSAKFFGLFLWFAFHATTLVVAMQNHGPVKQGAAKQRSAK